MAGEPAGRAPSPGQWAVVARLCPELGATTLPFRAPAHRPTWTQSHVPSQLCQQQAGLQSRVSVFLASFLSCFQTQEEEKECCPLACRTPAIYSLCLLRLIARFVQRSPLTHADQPPGIIAPEAEDGRDHGGGSQGLPLSGPLTQNAQLTLGRTHGSWPHCPVR